MRTRNDLFAWLTTVAALLFWAERDRRRSPAKTAPLESSLSMMESFLIRGAGGKLSIHPAAPLG